ncbi:MAG: hypothetical protein R3E91_02920 [Chlamydiales bacterium]
MKRWSLNHYCSAKKEETSIEESEWINEENLYEEIERKEDAGQINLLKLLTDSKNKSTYTKVKAKHYWQKIGILK